MFMRESGGALRSLFSPAGIASTSGISSFVLPFRIDVVVWRVWATFTNGSSVKPVAR